MKTAMQELLERVREYRDLETSLIAISRLNSVYVDILGMLEKEKEQIEDCWDVAHQAGRFEGKGIAEENWQTFEQYYNETFNTKEK